MYRLRKCPTPGRFITWKEWNVKIKVVMFRKSLSPVFGKHIYKIQIREQARTNQVSKTLLEAGGTPENIFTSLLVYG